VSQLALELDRPVAAHRKARTTDPATSRQAALEALPRQGAQRRRILEAIAQTGIRGVTYDDVSERLAMRGVSVSTRISELARGGWIEARGERRTSADALATVWVATEKAREALRG
jgi:DNA-binding transcriptional ArsR family regulator